jgi:probable rRNA maturation factor
MDLPVPHTAPPSKMILLDPDLDPELPHGPRPIRGGPDPAPNQTLVKKTAVSGLDKNKKIPSARTLARFLSLAQKIVRLKGEVSVLLTTDAAIRRLNRQFRGKNKATDVLSFPAEGIGAEKIAGDLAISVPTALRQAIVQNHALSIEIKVLILHGLLHLAGYDHEADKGQMARRERLLRARLKLPQGLIERVAKDQRSVILSDRSAAKGVEGPAVRLAQKATSKDLVSHSNENASSKAAVLKGNGFSRAAKSAHKTPALAAEGRPIATKAIPQVCAIPPLRQKQKRRKDGAPSVVGKSGTKRGAKP